MPPHNDTEQTQMELELPNETISDTTAALGDLEDALNRLAEETDAEYALVTLKPLTEDQHEANKALREHLRQQQQNND